MTRWTTEIGQRMRRHFLLKLVGTTAFTWVFFIGYFHLLRYPAYGVTVMPLTALDRLIPFQPWTLGAYLSLWLYIGVGPGLQLTFRELLVYGLWAAALCLTGLGLFYAWPTAVPPLTFDVSGYSVFLILLGFDAAGNACPTMHVEIAFFYSVRIEHVLRGAAAPLAQRLLNIAGFAAIAWATLAVKQHVVLDVIAGAALGLAYGVPSLRWRQHGSPAPIRADIIDRMPTDAAS
jgi:hypothetical protein